MSITEFLLLTDVAAPYDPDARTRGTSARDTIRMWPSVRKGEEENIFPYQEEADAMFNSALIYELAVLKLYVEPLLFGIPKTVRNIQR